MPERGGVREQHNHCHDWDNCTCELLFKALARVGATLAAMTEGKNRGKFNQIHLLYVSNYMPSNIEKIEKTE
jgi:hypothetical protein